MISISDELKFLIGFFYFNGWEEIYKSLLRKTEQRLKILVDLQVFQHAGSIVEYAENLEEGFSNDEVS